MNRLIPYAIVAILAAALVWFMKPDPAPVYRTVEVPTERIVEVERVDTVVRWRERIVFRTVEPTTVATADSGGTPDVESFCAAAVSRALAAASPPDSAPPPEPAPSLLLRSIRTEAGWFWKPDRLIATGPRSDGSLWQGAYDVRPGYQLRTRGPDLLVQSPRWAWLREAVELLAPAAVGYGVCRVLP